MRADRAENIEFQSGNAILLAFCLGVERQENKSGPLSRVKTASWKSVHLASRSYQNLFPGPERDGFFRSSLDSDIWRVKKNKTKVFANKKE